MKKTIFTRLCAVFAAITMLVGGLTNFANAQVLDEDPNYDSSEFWREHDELVGALGQEAGLEALAARQSHASAASEVLYYLIYTKTSDTDMPDYYGGSYLKYTPEKQNDSLILRLYDISTSDLKNIVEALDHFAADVVYEEAKTSYNARYRRMRELADRLIAAGIRITGSAPYQEIDGILIKVLEPDVQRAKELLREIYAKEYPNDLIDVYVGKGEYVELRTDGSTPAPGDSSVSAASQPASDESEKTQGNSALYIALIAAGCAAVCMGAVALVKRTKNSKN